MAVISLGFIIGIFLGSLVDCLSNRALLNESFWGRSYCDSCKKRLKWYDLFPGLSFVFLKGKCRYCHKEISPELLVVEVIMGFLVALLFYQYFTPSVLQALTSLKAPADFLNSYLATLTIDLIFKTFTLAILLSICITDIKRGIIPNRIVYPAIVVTFFYFLISLSYKIYLIYYGLSTNLLGRFLLPPHTNYLWFHAW